MMQCVSCRSCTQRTAHCRGATNLPIILISYPEAHCDNILRGAVSPISVVTTLGDTHVVKAAGTAFITALNEIISYTTIYKVLKATLNILIVYSGPGSTVSS